MPICQNCHNKWSFKQTINKSFTLDPWMTCPYCEEKQYQTKKSRMKSSLLNAIILLPLLINIFFDIPGVFLLGLFPVVFLIVMSLYPFIVELSSREEHINFFEK
ncbi:TIGR04104 family putative zinc finger protein [Virgibacillus sp. JSM 102003]|uniref:TIGR04104 family putative zinc finger protein n=1 Tax=Virgibacillus sp. JSM 102003 TaxID=1562108 RepID=UPI0035C1E30F